MPLDPTPLLDWAAAHQFQLSAGGVGIPAAAYAAAKARRLIGPARRRHRGAQHGWLIGYEGPAHLRPVFVSAAETPKHVEIVGDTGSGKTVLIANGILQQIRAGRAVAAVDPTKGDIIWEVCRRLRPEDREHLCIVNVSGRVHGGGKAGPAVGLGALHIPKSEEATEQAELQADFRVALYKQLFSDAWGKHLEHTFGNAFLTLAPVPGATDLEVSLLLTNERYRAHCLKQLAGYYPEYKELRLRHYWQTWSDMKPPELRKLMDPVDYKLSELFASQIAPLVGQSNPRGDPWATLDHGGIVLVRAPKSEIGEAGARLVSALTVQAVWRQALYRSRIPENRRPLTTLWLDEVPDVLNGRQAELLAKMIYQLRDKRVGLVLAHQDFEQVKGPLAPALGNALNKIVFRVSGDDAQAAALAGTTVANLKALPAYHCYVRPRIRNVPAGPFLTRCPDLKPPIVGALEASLAASDERWAMDRKTVEREISERHRGWTEKDEGGRGGLGLSDNGQSDPVLEKVRRAIEGS